MTHLALKCILYFFLFFSYFVAAQYENEIDLAHLLDQYVSDEDSREVVNPLSGKHLLVIPAKFPQNLELLKDSNGKIIAVSGPGAVIFEHIAISLNFTFEFYLEDNLPQFMDTENITNPGQIDFFLHQNADVMIGAFGFNAKRNKVIDYPFSIIIGQMALMIPALSIEGKNYSVVVWKPFQLPVWIGLIISLIIGTTSLYLVSLGLSTIQVKTEPIEKGLSNSLMSESTRFRKALNFIFGLIVVQGSASSQALGRSRQLAILLMAGAWCLVCFVLVTAYSSVVISFLTAPETFKPIINSINDLPMKPEIRVTVNKGWAPDKIFESAVGDEKSAKILRFVGQELKQHPEQRCVTVDKCIDIVREGSSVYIMENNFIEYMILEDWKKTGRCDFAVAKEKFLLLLVSGFILQKNSPYTKYFSLKIMRMEASGLLKVWEKQINRGRPCFKNDRFKRRSEEKKQITMKSLSGAFVVLGFGYSLAVAIFIIEICYSLILKNHRINVIQTKRDDSTIKGGDAVGKPFETKVIIEIDTIDSAAASARDLKFEGAINLNEGVNNLQTEDNTLGSAVLKGVTEDGKRRDIQSPNKQSEKDVKLSIQTQVLITVSSIRDNVSVRMKGNRTALKEAVPMVI